MIEKYSVIFPKIRSLDEEQFCTHFLVHIVHNLEYLISREQNKAKKEHLRSIAQSLEQYDITSNIEQLKSKGFDEDCFYNTLSKILL